MNEAVEKFRERMAAANQRFMDARMTEQRSMPFSEFSKVYGMARYWFRFGEEHQAWRRQLPSDAPVELQEQARMEAEVKSLDDVQALRHYHLDGTERPASSDDQRAYLHALEEVINETADSDVLSDHISLPAELGEFLYHTRGVYDADFRHSGICDLSFMKDADLSEDVLRQELRPFADREAWPSFVDEELEIFAGILVDENGQWPDYGPEYSDNKWYSMFVYCRPVAADDGDDDGKADQDFGWRVVFYQQKTEAEYDMWSFKTIPEFLDWYASWEERYDEAAMRIGVDFAPPGMGEGQAL